MLIQSSGRSCSFFRVPLQVFRTRFFLGAKDPYFLFIDVQSKVSLAFILVVHLALTSSFVGQASLGRLEQTLWFLRCQISIADLAIRILYKWLSPGLGFVLKFGRVHLVMLPLLVHYWPGARVSLFPDFFC